MYITFLANIDGCLNVSLLFCSSLAVFSFNAAHIYVFLKSISVGKSLPCSSVRWSLWPVIFRIAFHRQQQNFSGIVVLSNKVYFAIAIFVGNNLNFSCRTFHFVVLKIRRSFIVEINSETQEFLYWWCMCYASVRNKNMHDDVTTTNTKL